MSFRPKALVWLWDLLEDRRIVTFCAQSESKYTCIWLHRWVEHTSLLQLWMSQCCLHPSRSTLEQAFVREILGVSLDALISAHFYIIYDIQASLLWRQDDVVIYSYVVLHILTDHWFISWLMWHKYSTPTLLTCKTDNTDNDTTIQLSLPQYRYDFMHWKQCSPAPEPLLWLPHFIAYLIKNCNIIEHTFRGEISITHNITLITYEDRDQTYIAKEALLPVTEGKYQERNFFHKYCILILI